MRPVPATLLPISAPLGAPGSNHHTLFDPPDYPSGMVCRAAITPESASALGARSA